MGKSIICTTAIKNKKIVAQTMTLVCTTNVSMFFESGNF